MTSFSKSIKSDLKSKFMISCYFFTSILRIAFFPNSCLNASLKPKDSLKVAKYWLIIYGARINISYEPDSFGLSCLRTTSPVNSISSPFIFSNLTFSGHSYSPIFWYVNSTEKYWLGCTVTFWALNPILDLYTG